MKPLAFLLLLFALPAFAQKNAYEGKLGASWVSEGNGGGDWTVVLNQPVADTQACIYGPLKITDGWSILPGGFICYKGGHGSLHLMNFGSGPFFVDDEGYIFQSFVRYEYPRTVVRDFANGVH